MSTGSRPRVGISRCLLGDAVRFDGGHRHHPLLVSDLGAVVEWVPVCPELEVGMGVPREPIQLVARADGRVAGAVAVRLLGVTSDTDWTARMVQWGEARLDALLPLAGFVLKARSPSCGPAGVPVVYEGEAAAAIGRGLFAQLLVERMPGLPIEHEEALGDAAVRERFLAQVIACHERDGRL